MENKLIFAKEIIKEAGAFIKESLSKTITVEEKTAFDDLVTNIDKQTQDLLVARIKSAFPSDNIFAEENGLVHNIKDGNVWVLDPIDGTVNFIVQQDNFCVMIAYYEEGQGKFGLIYNVMADQLFYGGGQFDVYCNDKLLPAYKNRPLDRCLVASNGAMYAKNEAKFSLPLFIVGNHNTKIILLDNKIDRSINRIQDPDISIFDIMNQAIFFSENIVCREGGFNTCHE